MNNTEIGLLVAGIGGLALLVLGNKHIVEPPPEGPVTVNFTTDPPGADIYLDGVLRGVTPVTYSMAVGSYDLRFIKSGYEEHSQNLILTEDMAGTSVQTHVVLAPVAPTVPVLTMVITNSQKYAFLGYSYARLFGTIANNSGQAISGRNITVVKGYHSDTTGVYIEQQYPYALRIDGVPVSPDITPVTLPAGGSFPFDFVTNHLVDNLSQNFWLMDLVNGGRSNVVTLNR